jgi:hypothetical protein
MRILILAALLAAAGAAQSPKIFGKQGMFELTAIMGDYAMAAIMLRALSTTTCPTPPANCRPSRGRARTAPFGHGSET